MTGLETPVNEEVWLAYLNMTEAHQIFKDFVDYAHNPQSIQSAETYMMLLDNLDRTTRVFRGFENAWCIAKKGYSLN